VEVRRYPSTFTNPRRSVSTPAAARLSPVVSATQPTATTASVASALSRSPFLEKIIRTPVGVFSKESIVPKFSCTTIPDSRKAAETAADTSSSSLGRMRGPVWKSWIRDPYVLKIEATCTPVAPAPTTSIDGGTEVKRQASLWVLANSKPGTGSRRLTPPVQMMIFSA
jgi:hypothetical protein